MTELIKNRVKDYRPDIDGLRAIAVMSVIFYHFGVSGFSGGFVGVDIFFVISGFLITKGIVSNVDSKKFKISSFYLRRIRRLIPALLATIFFTFIVSFFILSPKDFSLFSGSAIYATLGISNIFFWMQSGYFDEFASLKPLLHTWSLGVELQFYFLWPFFLIAICTFFKRNRHRFFCIFLFTLLFSIISIAFVFYDSSGAFFLTPFRMHEFSIGAIVCFLDGLIKNKKINTTIYILGFSLVIIPVLTYDSAITFPGYLAIYPCIGAALLILSGNKTSLSDVVSNRIGRHIGEISYSLYLVHWPVYVFATYLFISEPAILLICVFTLAYMLYFLIEKPLRVPSNNKKSDIAFALTCGLFAIFIIIPLKHSQINNGWDWRLAEGIRNINKVDDKDAKDYTWVIQTELSQRQSFPDVKDKPNVLIIGDSQSADIINIMDSDGMLEKYNVIAKTVYFDCGSPYVIPENQNYFFDKENALTIKRPDLKPACKRQFDAVLNKDLLSKADKVYISLFYQKNLIPYIKDGIDEIKKHTEAKIYIFGRKNLSKGSIDIANSFGRVYGIERYASKFRDNDAKYINHSLSLIEGTTFIDMLDYTCPNKSECIVLTDNKEAIFYDYAHLTRFGSKFLAKKMHHIF